MIYRIETDSKIEEYQDDFDEATERFSHYVWNCSDQTVHPAIRLYRYSDDETECTCLAEIPEKKEGN